MNKAERVLSQCRLIISSLLACRGQFQGVIADTDVSIIFFMHFVSQFFCAQPLNMIDEYKAHLPCLRSTVRVSSNHHVSASNSEVMKSGPQGTPRPCYRPGVALWALRLTLEHPQVYTHTKRCARCVWPDEIPVRYLWYIQAYQMRNNWFIGDTQIPMAKSG